MVPRNNSSAYPLLAVCCFILVLFAIAVTIVLGLIPVYLPKKTVSPSTVYAFEKTETFSINVSDDSPTGILSATETTQLTTLLQSSLSDATKSNGNVNVKSAEIVAANKSVGDRKRRQGSSKILILVIFITGRTNNVLAAVQSRVKSYIQQTGPALGAAAATIVNSRITTISPAIVSTSAAPTATLSPAVSGRRRRQEYEGPSTPPPVTYRD